MIHTIREAFNELLAENHWMDEETGMVAKEKADAMNERIGYPQMITNPVELIKEYNGVGNNNNAVLSSYKNMHYKSKIVKKTSNISKSNNIF